MKNTDRCRKLSRAGFFSTWFALGISLGSGIARAQQSVAYPEAYYQNDRCLPPCRCALGTLEGRIFGSYTLNLVSIGDVFDFYTIDDINFSIMTQTGPLAMTGSGVYQQSTIIGQQYMRLEVVLGNSIGPITLESDFVPLEVDLPAIKIEISEFDIACTAFTTRFVGGPAVACTIDFDAGDGLGIPDNAVDVSDLLYFLAKYEEGNVAVDLVGGPCGCPDCFCPDGAVDVQDLLYFLRHFERGC